MWLGSWASIASVRIVLFSAVHRFDGQQYMLKKNELQQTNPSHLRNNSTESGRRFLFFSVIFCAKEVKIKIHVIRANESSFPFLSFPLSKTKKRSDKKKRRRRRTPRRKFRSRNRHRQTCDWRTIEPFRFVLFLAIYTSHSGSISPHLLSRWSNSKAALVVGGVFTHVPMYLHHRIQMAKGHKKNEKMFSTLFSFTCVRFHLAQRMFKEWRERWK